MLVSSTKSIFWSGIQQFTISGSQFIITIVIARILTPEDYGLLAMLTIFFAFTQAFIDSGLTGALIQKKDHSQEDCNTVFYFNVIVSLMFYVILFFSAPLIARLYDNDLLITLTRVFSLNLIINAFVGVQRVLIIKRLMFKQLAIITAGSSLVSGAMAIVMAYSGFSYWSLVAQILTASTLSGLLIYYKVHWTPTFSFSKESARLLFSFGLPVMFTSIIHAIYNNLYSLVIGLKYKAEDLGYYNRAATFSSFIPINAGNFVAQALFPIQSLIQDEYEQVRASYLKAIHTLAFFVIPINVFVLVNAEDIILVLLTEKWIIMKPFLQLLCVASVWYPILNMQNTTIKVFGKTKVLFWSELLKKILGISVIFITVNYNIIIMVWGLFFFSFFELAIGSFFFQKVSNISIREQLKVYYYIPISAIAFSLVAFFISSFISIMFCRLLISGLLFVALYGAWGLWRKDQAMAVFRGIFGKK